MKISELKTGSVARGSLRVGAQAANVHFFPVKSTTDADLGHVYAFFFPSVINNSTSYNITDIYYIITYYNYLIPFFIKRF
jgi:hypothetical protein